MVTVGTGSPSNMHRTTSFTTDLSLNMQDFLRFDEAEFAASVVAATNLDASQVDVLSVTFTIKLVIAFDDTVALSDAKTVVALANSVQEPQVTMTISSGRRLEEEPRRLADTSYKVSIRAADEIEARGVMGSSGNPSLLALHLNDVAPDAPFPRVVEQPVAKVVVQTDLIGAAGSSAPPMPSVAEMTSALEQNTMMTNPEVERVRRGRFAVSGALGQSVVQTLLVAITLAAISLAAA